MIAALPISHKKIAVGPLDEEPISDKMIAGQSISNASFDCLIPCDVLYPMVTFATQFLEAFKVARTARMAALGKTGNRKTGKRRLETGRFENIESRNQGIRKTETPQYEGQNEMLQKLLLIQKYNEDPHFERQPEWMRG